LSSISPEKEYRIYEMKLKGYSNREIAKKLKVSVGTVSNYEKKFRDLVRKGTIPREYGVRDLYESVMALAVELRRNKSSLPEALQGAKMLTKLSGLGVGLEKVKVFVSLCSKLATENGYEAEEFVPAAIRLASIEEETGKNYQQVIKEYKEVTNKIPKLKKDKSDLLDFIKKTQSALQNLKNEKEEAEKSFQKLLEDLEDEEKKAREKHQHFLEEHDLTMKKVKDVVDLQARLATQGITLKNVEQLHAVLNEVKRLGFDPTQIATCVEELGSLQNKISVLMQDADKKQRSLQDIITQIENAEKAKKKILDDIDRLEEEKERILTEKKNKCKTYDEMINERVKQVGEWERKVGEMLNTNADAEAILSRLDELNSEIAKLEQKIQGMEQYVALVENFGAIIERKTPADRKKIINMLQLADFRRGFNKGDELARKYIVEFMAEEGYVPKKELDQCKTDAEEKIKNLEGRLEIEKGLAKKSLEHYEECMGTLKKEREERKKKSEDTAVEKAGEVIYKIVSGAR